MGSERGIITRQFYCILLVCVLFAVLDGLTIGLLTGLVLQPLPTPRDENADHDEYVALVSASFYQSRDLAEASRRLDTIEPDRTAHAQLVEAAAQRLAARQGAGSAAWMAELAAALRGGAVAANIDQPPTSTPIPTAASPSMLETSTPTAEALSAKVQAPTPAQPVSSPTGTALPDRTATRLVRVSATPTPRAVATFKPLAQPQATSTPTATRTSLAQPTSTATWTPTAARVGPPTATATWTTTVTAPQSSPTATATPTAPAASPSPTVFSGADYRVTLERQLTPCENQGNHNIYVVVLDTQGNGIPDVEVEMVWPSGSTRAFTGQKVEYIPYLGVNAKTTAGYLNFALFKGSYRVHVVSASSDWSSWLSVDIPQDQLCPTNDNPVANSLFHYSYLVDFQKVR